MFLKLFKYDLISGAKQHLLMLIILAMASVIIVGANLLGVTFFNGILLVLALIASIAYFVIYVILAVGYYYRSVSGRQAYLTYTIPAKPAAIYFAKITSAYLWFLFTAAVIFCFWKFVGAPYLLGETGAMILDGMRESLGADADRFLQLMLVVMPVQISAMFFSASFYVGVTALPRFKNRGNGLAAGIVGFLVANQVVGLITAGIWLGVSLAQGYTLDSLNGDLMNMTDMFNRLISIDLPVMGLVSVVYAALSIRFIKRSHSV